MVLARAAVGANDVSRSAHSSRPSSPGRRSHANKEVYMHKNLISQKRALYLHRTALRIPVLAFFLISACTFVVFGYKTVPAAHAVANGQSLTPPMGWDSWNAHFGNINASVIQAAATAIANSGMKAAGYQFVNIDEGWWKGTRDSNGNITVDTNQWPGGMAAIASFIHSKGLKAGIYTDAGTNGCGGTNQGSFGHYAQDFLQFEQWGFDYVKVDWCGGVAAGLNPAVQYPQVRDAIAQATAQTGHPMTFSVTEWGLDDPWTWGPGTGNLWRTSNDISFSQGSVAWNDILKNFDAAMLHPDGQSIGSYNDPDMMEVGAAGINTTETQAHFSLWAIAGAPLIAGNDVTNMSNTTQSILTNSEVIAVDQD